MNPIGTILYGSHIYRMQYERGKEAMTNLLLETINILAHNSPPEINRQLDQLYRYLGKNDDDYRCVVETSVRVIELTELKRDEYQLENIIPKLRNLSSEVGRPKSEPEMSDDEKLLELFEEVVADYRACIKS